MGVVLGGISVTKYRRVYKKGARRKKLTTETQRTRRKDRTTKSTKGTKKKHSSHRERREPRETIAYDSALTA